MRATICLPTYNELENLERWSTRSHRCCGTATGCSSSTTPRPTEPGSWPTVWRRKRVREVLHRPRKEGLGPAYKAGFREALAAGAELILEMDCDFSHDPADVRYG